MTLEQRMSAMEAAYGKQSELMRELRDAVTVTAHLEARQGKILVEHGEWLRQHEAAVKKFDEDMVELKERISGLVSGIGEFMRRDLR
jgi:uncharacterized coiled-coil protein SlyX